MHDKGHFVFEKSALVKRDAQKTVAEVAAQHSIFALNTPVVLSVASTPSIADAVDAACKDSRSTRKADLCI